MKDEHTPRRVLDLDSQDEHLSDSDNEPNGQARGNGDNGGKSAQVGRAAGTNARRKPAVQRLSTVPGRNLSLGPVRAAGNGRPLPLLASVQRDRNGALVTANAQARQLQTLVQQCLARAPLEPTLFLSRMPVDVTESILFDEVAQCIQRLSQNACPTRVRLAVTRSQGRNHAGCVYHVRNGRDGGNRVGVFQVPRQRTKV